MSSSIVLSPTLNYPPTFQGGIDFYFSLLALAIGVIACVYFLFEWGRHHERRFLLYWAFGFLTLYWFEIPSVLANAGVGLVVAEFNLFYAVSFPLSFIGFIAIYAGIRSVWPKGSHNKLGFLGVMTWIAVAFVFFADYIGTGSAAASHLVPAAAVLFFLAPAQLLIMSALWKWFVALPRETGAVARTGILIMGAAMVLSFAEGFMALEKIIAYPADFWFVALSDFRLLFVLQSVTTFLLVIGFLFVHRGFMRVRARSGADAAGSGFGGVQPQSSDLALPADAPGAPQVGLFGGFPKWVISIVVAELAGVIGSLFVVPTLPNWYADLAKPSFTPPGWTFTAVWIALFLFMGISAALVWRHGLDRADVKRALAVFLVQLVLNIGWSVLFFGAHFLLAAFIEVIVLWAAIFWAIILFWKLSRTAAWLLVPYLLWVTFAAVLTFSIWQLN